MAKKPSGLSAFAARKDQPAAMAETSNPAPAASMATSTASGVRKGRAQGETVALTVRISRTDWMRLHQLALSERSSLQALAIDGFSEVLKRHGLSPIKTS